MCACVSKIRWLSSPGILFSFWLSTKTHSRNNYPFGVEFKFGSWSRTFTESKCLNHFGNCYFEKPAVKKAYVLGPSNFETRTHRINAYQKDKCWNSWSILRNGTCLFRFPHAVWKRQMHTIMIFLVARLIVGFGRTGLGIWIVPSMGLLLAVIHGIQSTNRPLRKGNLVHMAHDKSRGRHLQRWKPTGEFSKLLCHRDPKKGICDHLSINALYIIYTYINVYIYIYIYIHSLWYIIFIFRLVDPCRQGEMVLSHTCHMKSFSNCFFCRIEANETSDALQAAEGCHSNRSWSSMSYQQPMDGISIWMPTVTTKTCIYDYNMNRYVYI